MNHFYNRHDCSGQIGTNAASTVEANAKRHGDAATAKLQNAGVDASIIALRREINRAAVIARYIGVVSITISLSGFGLLGLCCGPYFRSAFGSLPHNYFGSLELIPVFLILSGLFIRILASSRTPTRRMRLEALALAESGGLSACSVLSVMALCDDRKVREATCGALVRIIHNIETSDNSELSSIESALLNVLAETNDPQLLSCLLNWIGDHQPDGALAAVEHLLRLSRIRRNSENYQCALRCAAALRGAKGASTPSCELVRSAMPPNCSELVRATILHSETDSNTLVRSSCE